MKITKSTLSIFLIAIVAAIAGLLLGYDAGIIGICKDQVTALFSLSDNQWSLIASAAILGAIVGLPISGSLSNYLGRKNMLIIVALCFIVGIILTATAHEITLFIVGRFFIGLSVGAGSFTAPLFISELAPTNIRGLLILINGIALTLGQALSFLTGYFLHDISIDSWRYLIWIGIIPASFLLIGMICVPQSPRWVAMKYGVEHARKILHSIRNNLAEVEKELHEISTALTHYSRKSTFTELLSKKLIKVTFLGMALGIFQQFMGISALMYYGPVIFSTAGFNSVRHAIFATFLIGIVNLLTTIATMFLVDYFGRRPLLLFGTFLAGVSLIIVGLINTGMIQNKWLTLFFMASYILGYCMSLGSLFWVIIAEIYPLKVRGLAMSLASTASTLASLIITITFLQIINFSGLTGIVWLYSLMCFISFIFIYYWVPETKGISLEEIENTLTIDKDLDNLNPANEI